MEKNIKQSSRNNKFIMSGSAWDDEFELIKYIIRKHETLTEKPPIQIFINKVENRITFTIKSGYYPEFLTPKR